MTDLSLSDQSGVPRSGSDVWESLVDRLDPLNARPELARIVEIVGLPWVRSGQKALIAQGSTVFSLDADEAKLCALMDGTRSVRELVAVGPELTGSLDPGITTTLVTMLSSAGFLVGAPPDINRALDRALNRPRRITTALNGARTLSVQWDGADRLARFLYRRFLSPVMNTGGMLASAAIVLLGLAGFISILTSHDVHLTPQAPGWSFVLFMALFLVAIFIHELGHAAVVTRHGRAIRSAGMRLYFGSPAFFVDAPQALLLSRCQRMAQALAGPWFQSVVAGVAAMVLWLAPHGWASPVLYRFVVINYFVILVNLIPLLELDGYWIFSDAIGVPDLRRRSLSLLRHDLWRKLGRHERITRVDLGILLYAVAGTGFAVASLWVAAFFWREVFGSVVVRLWHGGAVGILLLVILATVVAAPLIAASVQVLSFVGRRCVALERQVRFRFQRGWRIEAAELFDRSDSFEDLPLEALNELAGRMRLIDALPGQAVISQGDPARSFLLIRSGHAACEVEDPQSGEVRTVATIGPGDSFGELGLIRHEPRNATVRATTNLEIFEVDASSFHRLLAPHLRPPSMTTTIQEMAQLGTVPVLSLLDRSDLEALMNDGDWLLANPGEDLVVQGAEADGFRVLLEGQAEVIRDGSVVAQLGPGDHFGELAHLQGVPRAATVRALTPVRVFRISPAGFDHLISASLRSTSANPLIAAAAREN